MAKMIADSASSQKASKNLALASLFLGCVFALLEINFIGLTHDTNFFMHCALKLWQYGPSTIYDHCRDQNAPFHMLLYSPLAAFSASLHLQPAFVLHGVTALFCAASLSILNHVLKQHSLPDEERYRWIALAAFTLLVVSVLFGVYADREHLLFVFIMPWLVQMLLGLSPLPYSCFFAAIGFCMKPHDVVLFLLMTMVGGPRERTLLQRIFSTSSWIIGLCLLLYASYIAIFIPRYIQDVLPIAAVVYPSKYYNMDFKITRGLFFVVLSTGMVLRYAPKGRKLCWLAFIISTAIVYLLNAGWFYTFYLLTVPMAMALITPWLSENERSTNARQSGKLLAVTLAALIFAFCCAYVKGSIHMTRTNRFSTYYAYLNPPLFKALDAAAEERFILLSYSTWESSVENFAQKPQSVFAYDNLWSYPWLYSHSTDPHYSRVLRFVLDPLVEALEKHPDAVVIEDISPEPLVDPEGVIGFFRRDERFRAAFSQYAKRRTFDYCSAHNQMGCRFAVWKRDDK